MEYYINIVIRTEFFKWLEITVIHSNFHLSVWAILWAQEDSCLQDKHQLFQVCPPFSEEKCNHLVSQDPLQIHIFLFNILCHLGNVASQFLIFHHFRGKNCIMEIFRVCVRGNRDLQLFHIVNFNYDSSKKVSIINCFLETQNHSYSATYNSLHFIRIPPNGRRIVVLITQEHIVTSPTWYAIWKIPESCITVHN